ncbi:hypothetical protein ALP90_200237 [Pseudomonas amygdali pv. ulmi]|uniref:Uncharacterized protein n=1 Tax=Pseudomonas amygdali pv. ulmi TaxID=251720 RepID=A0A3M4S8D6_PSEA0|nr:hypothetical protein [Pseudomonas amygdali]RMR11220.1 hypothetical protein ALP90_200237 [Pseudomonas amygdali pv. ulmi]
MNFKNVHTGEGYNRTSRKNLILHALIEYERMYQTHRMLPQAVFERFSTTQHEFCEAIGCIAMRLAPINPDDIIEGDSFLTPVTIEEIDHLLHSPLYEVMSLPSHEGLTR